MRKQEKHRRSRNPEQPGAKSRSVPVDSAVPTLSTRRRWMARLAGVFFAPLLLFVLLEGALRLIGFGYATTFFVPAGDGKLTTNPKFAWQFYPRETATSPTPLIISKAKPSGTKRVFILGESAAAGTPDPAFSFSRMLEIMLENPAEPVEIINVAMRGIDSHIVKRIAAECATLSPDLFVVYAGNNDSIGLHSPDPTRSSIFSRPFFITAQHAVKRSRVSQLLHSGLAALSGEKAKQDMESVRRQRLAFDDPKRELIYANYRRNLEQICELAADAGARVALCSVAANLRDFPPLGSLHRRDLSPDSLAEWERHYTAGAMAEGERQHALALKHFQAAAEIDDHYAELHFRIARCAEAGGNREQARQHYLAARDRDSLQFRTDSRMNEVIREVAARRGPKDVRFVDVEAAFAASALAQNGLPGSRLFQEHVHFTFDGDYELARAVLPEVRAALGMAPSAPKIDRDGCARRLAYTPVEAANVLAAMAQMLSKPPFVDQLEHTKSQAALQERVQGLFARIDRPVVEQTRATYLAALQHRPDDWMLRLNYARLLTDLGEHVASVPEYERVVRLFPQRKRFRLMFGMALLHARRASEAAREFTEAIRIDPEFGPAKQALAHLQTGK